MEHGFDLSRLVADLFANRIGSFFGMDVFVSSGAVLVILASQRRIVSITEPAYTRFISHPSMPIRGYG